MKKAIIIILFCIGILAAAIYPRLTTKEQFAQAIADPVVEVASPEYGDIKVESAVVGTIKASESSSVSLKAGGDVTEVFIKAGDIVEEGQTLFTIDTKQVESAKNALDSASLNLSTAQDELNREAVLYSGGGISTQAYKQYQDAVKSAQIAYEDAKTNYENQISYSTVVSPINGIVELVNIEKLDTVSSGTEACVISSTDSKYVEFEVSERIVKNLAEGDEIAVEKEGSEYSGTITEISTMADSTTGLYKVNAKLEESDAVKALNNGSKVKLNVVSEKSLDTLMVPVDSVYYDGGLSYVYTYDTSESCLHKIEVKTGVYNSEYMEILSGITEDDLVLITWTSELYEGTKVRLKGEN